MAKTENKQGLAEVAIQWYWDRHANYASIAKRLMQDVVTPIQILNQRVDRVVGLVRAGADDRRLQRHLASLDFRVALLSEIAVIKGIDMPRAASESPHSSSDSDNYLRVTDKEGRIIPITLDIYKEGTVEFTGEVGESIQAGVLAKIKARIGTQEGQVTSSSHQDEEHTTKKPRLGGL